MNEQLPFDGRIAVAGVALRAPGASCAADFWSNLRAGIVSLPASDANAPALEFRPRQIARLREFDRHLFGMQPAEAIIADPQQRIFLELVWEAFEDAGIDPGRSKGRVGVFAGCGRDDYRRQLLDATPRLEQIHGRQQIEMGNDRDYFATNVAYRFNLKGPSFTVQSACSTSLVAIHLAVRSLLTGECDVAVAGGLTLQIPEVAAYRHQEGGIYSPDGRCRPFTEGSEGTVPASGGGAVILLRAGDAEELKLRPYAYVVGTAANNDGAGKMNFAAPALEGHVDAIVEALDFARLQAEHIGFVQAHGTGTRLGDQIELDALRQTYGRTGTSGPKRCAVGSIKANIGHSDAGAGVLGFITCALSLKEKSIPPTPSQPGDGRDVLGETGQSRLFLPRAEVQWEDDGPRRRAAVSSLGVGGSNAHVVLEDVPDPPSRHDHPNEPVTIAVSAATAEALQASVDRLLPILDDAQIPVGAAASMLWHGRRHLAYRRTATADTPGAAAQKLRGDNSVNAVSLLGNRSRRLAVLLPGQGVSIDRTYAELLRSDGPLRREFLELRDAIVSAGGPDVLEYQRLDQSDPRLGDTAFVQPLLFAIQIALSRALRIDTLGPSLIVGHSLGEFVAATIGGLFDDGAAAAAVVKRSRLMADAPEGAMVTIRASDDSADQLASEFDLDVAARLSPTLSVLAGAPGAVGALVEAAGGRDVAAIPLPVTRAFHSRSMEHAAREFGRFLSSHVLKPPSIPIASNLDGSVLEPARATDPQYWGDQIRRTVDLRSAVETLISTDPAGILDLGPGDGLTNLVRERTAASAAAPLFFPVAPGRPGKHAKRGLDAIAAAWEAGFDVELPVERTLLERLPTYPFDNTAYWPDATTDETSQHGDNKARDQATATVPAANTEAVQGEPEEVFQTVHRIWSEAFGRTDVAEDDDFFEVGGTSIHATQILRRLKTECGVNIRLHDLYDFPVLGEFSRHVAYRLEVDGGTQGHRFAERVSQERSA